MSLTLSLVPYLFDSHGSSGEGKPWVGSRAIQEGEAASPAADPAELRLVAGIIAGDVSALEAIIAQYAESLTRFGVTLTGSRQLGEELAYEAFARLWEHRNDLHSSRSSGPYLFTIVRNLAAHTAERARVRERFAQRVGQEADPDAETRVALPPDELLIAQEDAAADRARLAQVRRAIAALPERRRVVLHLRFEQGLSYPAIGAIVGLSDKAVQQLVLRTVAALRRAIST